ncbi:MAG: apolipoprotein N-acyltransferase [Pantoea sp. Brub]|nr:apolipoprotein N-acyltransferase [Pantoea sp. Brub]
MVISNIVYQKQWVRLILAFITGMCGIFAFSPYNIDCTALFSLCSLQILLLNRNNIQSAIIGLIWGCGLFSVGISWIYISIVNFSNLTHLTSIVIIALIVLYLSIYPALFAILLNILCPKVTCLRLVFAAPALWHITEFLRSKFFTGFPWLQFGYSQIDGLLKGFAPLAGVETITFILMFISGLIIFSITCNNIKSILIIVILFIISCLLNFMQWYQPLHNNVSVALVQGNIPQKIKWNLTQTVNNENIYLNLSKHWIGKVSIIVWPESAIAELEINKQLLLSRIDNLIKNTSTSLITGIIDNKFNKHNNIYYNSILVLDSNNKYHYPNNNHYYKNHLVPFGEYIPIKKLLQLLGLSFNFPILDLHQGNYIQPPLKVNGYNILSAICYEIILGEKIRANLHSDTNLLLTISNDAWFGNSIGPWQHFQMARMRALEFGRPLLIATNNGITAVIDANGDIENILPQFKRNVLISTITLTKGKTPYSYIGYVPLWFVIFLFLTFIITCKLKIIKLII